MRISHHGMEPGHSTVLPGPFWQEQVNDILSRQEHMLLVPLLAVLEPVITWMPRQHRVPHGAAPFIHFNAIAPLITRSKRSALIFLIKHVGLKNLQRQRHT